jgi:hypothetical protein
MKHEAMVLAGATGAGRRAVLARRCKSCYLRAATAPTMASTTATKTRRSSPLRRGGESPRAPRTAVAGSLCRGHSHKVVVDGVRLIPRAVSRSSTTTKTTMKTMTAARGVIRKPCRGPVRHPRCHQWGAMLRREPSSSSGDPRRLRWDRRRPTACRVKCPGRRLSDLRALRSLDDHTFGLVTLDDNDCTMFGSCS